MATLIKIRCPWTMSASRTRRRTLATTPVSQCSLRGRVCVWNVLTVAFVLVTADAVFAGITTFAKLPWVKCLSKERNVPFDIAFLGAPFVSHKKQFPYPPHSPHNCWALMVSLFRRTPAHRTGREHDSDPPVYVQGRVA